MWRELNVQVMSCIGSRSSVGQSDGGGSSVGRREQAVRQRRQQAGNILQLIFVQIKLHLPFFCPCIQQIYILLCALTILLTTRNSINFCVVHKLTSQTSYIFLQIIDVDHEQQKSQHCSPWNTT
eukprot:g27246.t1